MGLDMYLEKRIYIGGQYEYRQVDGTIYITIQGNKVPIELNEVQSITVSAAYWRKANAIHKWFVDTVQNGKDDCGEYQVTVAQLKELVSLCEQVLRNKEEASELLPTQEGFFFGSTEYNEWYETDLKETIKMINKAIKGCSDDDWETSFYYSSSW